MLNSFCFLDDLFLAFYYSSLAQEISRLELSSTITTVLRANRLTKCAIHPLLMYEFTFVCWYRTSYIVDIAVCMTSILEQRNCYNDDDILVLHQHDTLPWNKGSLYFSNSTISSSAWNLKYLPDGTIKFCGLLLFLEYSITIDYWRVAILEDSGLEGTTRQKERTILSTLPNLKKQVYTIEEATGKVGEIGPWRYLFSFASWAL